MAVDVAEQGHSDVITTTSAAASGELITEARGRLHREGCRVLAWSWLVSIQLVNLKGVLKFKIISCGMAEEIDLDLTIASYNMHGYNQGVSLLKSMCNNDELNFVCVLVQEHWLTSSNLVKLKSF